MSLTTHQTVELAKGRHRSPEQGVCVMELASMLAGETFSDHPTAVCPVIAEFLRTYNDSIDDEQRQDLYAYASQVVGSRGPEEVARARAAHLSAWTDDLRRRRRKGFWLSHPIRAFNWGLPTESVSVRAVREVLHADDSRARALTAIDQLLAIGAASAPAPAVLDTDALAVDAGS